MKFNSKPIAEHEEVPLADDGRLESIVETSKQRKVNPDACTEAEGIPCYVLSVGRERDTQIRAAQLAEIRGLVCAQDGRIVGEEIYHLAKENPRTLIGPGAAKDIALRACKAGANLIVIDAELTPSQLRNLEDSAGMSVCDREAVILNVFLRHARTQRAKTQIEIARLEYLRPRICGVGINMDQQAGGVGGARGPGETASELMARKLDSRLAELKKVQRRLEQSGEVQRQARDGSKRIVLVGYTNAGKTSLMNTLCGEKLSVRDRPFETLDTTSRSLSRHGGHVLISDTVGFIRRLPERLIASFESTLAEVREASLLVIVVDASDYEWRAHISTTVEMIGKLGAKDRARHYVFNKADKLSSTPDAIELEKLSEEFPYSVLSSRDESAVERLKATLLGRVREEQRRVALFVPYEASRIMSAIYGKCRIFRNDPTEKGLNLVIQGDSGVLSKIQKELEEAIR